jgi:hypothetical protein
MESAANRDGAQPTCSSGGSGEIEYRRQEQVAAFTLREYDRDHGTEAEQAKRIAEEQAKLSR